jgi:hypothetical protein
MLADVVGQSPAAARSASLPLFSSTTLSTSAQLLMSVGLRSQLQSHKQQQQQQQQQE